MSVFGNGMNGRDTARTGMNTAKNGMKHRMATARTGVWSSVRARVISIASTVTVLIMALVVGACSQDYRSCVVDGVTVYGPFGNGCPHDVLATVELTLVGGVGSATVTAEIVDGAIDTPVSIEVIINGPNNDGRSGSINDFSGAAGHTDSVAFDSLADGEWTLRSVNPPGGVILNIPTASQSAIVGLPPPETTITPRLTADGDDLEVQVTARGTLARSASVELTLTGGSSPVVRTVPLTAGDNPSASETFADLSSGNYRLTATAGAGLDISTFSPFVFTVRPKVHLSLAPGSAAQTVTATATIVSGTITPADSVTVIATISGPGGAGNTLTLGPGQLSGGTGQKISATFTGLAPGSWTLSTSSRAAPSGKVLFRIPPATASAPVADPGAPPVTLSVSSTTLFYGIGLTATVSASRAPAADATLSVVATPKPGRSGVQQTQTVAMTRSDYTNLMTTFRLVPGQYRLTITTTSSAVNVSGAVVETVTINAVTVTVTTSPPSPVRHDQPFMVSARVTTPSTGYSGTVALALRGIDAPQTLNLSRNTQNSYNFRTLTPGDYTLTVTSLGATITPSLPISFTVSSPPLVTAITPTLTGDDLTVRVAASGTLTSPASVMLTLTSAESPPVVRTRTANLAARNNPGNSVSFNNLPSGTYTLTAGAGAGLDISAFTSREVVVLPKVNLSLVSNAPGTATVTARIADGTIGAPVTINAIINRTGGGIDSLSVGPLSGSSGTVSATFTGLTPGSWRLSSSSSATPRDNVLLNIPAATASADVAAPALPETSVTATVDGNDVTVTVAITDGTTLTSPIQVELKLNDDDALKRDVFLAKGSVNPSISTTYTGLPDGNYTLTVSTDELNITERPATIVAGDDDNDGVFNSIDVDDDNDGLIEINFLEDLDFVRHNLAGTSYDDEADDGLGNEGATDGAPTGTTGTACDGITTTTNLCGYELARSLDFDEAASYRSGRVNAAWTGGAGWTPIGSLEAIFEGNGHTIADLRVARGDTIIFGDISVGRSGLFSSIGGDGVVRRLTLRNAQVSYTGSAISVINVGSLAGSSSGTIMAVSVIGGTVSGGDGDGDTVGGLVGVNSTGGVFRGGFIVEVIGTITDSYASGAINGGDGDSDSVGGLVGDNFGGTITASYATGRVDGGDGGEDEVGGLVGSNYGDGTITASYATGDVDGGDGSFNDVGGLVGWNFEEGTITASYATGDVDGGDGSFNDVGGLVGQNNRGTITASYATGRVDGGDGGEDEVGGLVGRNDNDSTITASYAGGDVDGGDGHRDFVGGLVGFNGSGGTITASYATGDANGGDGSEGEVGGLVGLNRHTITASYATGDVDGGDGFEDRVGGLAGHNDGTITASYATGRVDGGDGGEDEVGGLVGFNNGTTTASYGFGTKMGGETAGVDRSSDASPAVVGAAQFTAANSSTNTSNRWSAQVWNFGTAEQYATLKWVTASNFTCDQTLLPTGQRCGELIPGQTRNVPPLDGSFSRVGTQTNFGVGETFPGGLVAINDTLYMAGTGTDHLYTLNTGSGRATQRSTTANFRFGVGEGTPAGLATIGSTLYMVGGTNKVLYTLNTGNGRATRKGSATNFGVGESSPTGLAAIGNTLYMVGQSNRWLYSVDRNSGRATRVGTQTNFGVNETQPRGLAAIGNTLYMVGDSTDTLYTIDTSSGRATRVGNAPSGFGVSEAQPRGLAAIGNTLYMLGDNRNALYAARRP